MDFYVYLECSILKGRVFCLLTFKVDNCAINDGREFGESFLKIYPKDLELKVGHYGNHACFLNLSISNNNNILVYKLIYNSSNVW